MRITYAVAFVLATLTLVGGARAQATTGTTTFAAAGDRAEDTLLHYWYAGEGQWKICDAPDCGRWNRDWGADALTYATYLRWTGTHDPRIAAKLGALVPTAPSYGPPCTSGPCGWSDVPAWDSIAALREYEVTHDPRALAKAQAGFAYVEDSKVYALGACPRIDYQQPNGEANELKTLETDANMIKAALLLYRATHTPAYLDYAVRRYDAVRAYFLDPDVPLYSVYVFDNGRTCTQVPHRFFASVNGDMIWNGWHLARITHDQRYDDEAIATAQAVDRNLSDPAGIFADLQAENDIVEPLVEAMYVLARDGHVAFARRWILRNAAAALPARNDYGTFGRFFDGPAPKTTTTQWQVNGGLALELAAAALAPKARVQATNRWQGARYVTEPVSTLPTTVTITGSAVAFIGTLGEHCCEAGHARVFIDGVETFNGTGIWQNKSSSGRSIPGTVLLAWRWPSSGTHTFRFEPGVPNGKQGDAFLHLSGYYVVR
jgi:hypothetical protein